MDDLKNRISGCLWGQAVGDALGLCSEFLSREDVKAVYPEGLSRYEQSFQDAHRKRWKIGDWTDDTDMLLCIAKAIIKDEDIIPATVAHNFKEWYRGYPMGIGKNTVAVLGLTDYEESPEKAAEMVWEANGRKNAPNGGIMRTSIVGLWNENVTGNAENICRLTHADPRCIGSCVIVSEMINSLVWKNAELPVEKLYDIADAYDRDISLYLESALNGTLEELELDDTNTMGYTLKAMACGLWCIYHVSDFKEGLLAVVNAGGDADTNAAVACSLLGAKYGFNGIPRYYIDNLRKKDEYASIVNHVEDILIRRFAGNF